MSSEKEGEGFSVLVDDQRDNHRADIICRNARAALAVIRDIPDPIKVLYMDHDLGDGPSGYDVLKEALDWPKKYQPREVALITMNPVGKERMVALLVENGYHRITGTDRYRPKPDEDE